MGMAFFIGGKMPILGMILPALLPAVMDGLRGIFAKFTGGAGGTPQNMTERIQLMQAETAKLQALAEADRPTGEISKWVADMRASFRYISILTIWAATIAAVFMPGVQPQYTLILLDLSGACFSFIIGERAYIGIKK
jgi:hypothetical protein